MNSTDITLRFKHSKLPTQQRRLRHLRSIAARNIHLLNTKLGTDVSEIETYFSLHKQSNTSAFYTSEKVLGSLNPTYRSFNPCLLAETKPIDTCIAGYLSIVLQPLPALLAEPCTNPFLVHLVAANANEPAFVVKVWQGQGTTFYKCIEWHISLSGLTYIGDKIQRDGSHYEPNTLIFGMLDGFYGTTSYEGDQSGPQNISDVVAVDQASIRESYSTQTVSRIQTILRAIKQTQASVTKVRNCIEEKLSHSQTLKRKKSEAEERVLQVNLMRSDLEWRTMRLQSEKELYEQIQSAFCQKDIAVKDKFDTLHKDKKRLHEKKKGYLHVREELIKNGAQLVMRRKQLISELTFIYPIKEVEADVYTICGVKLPNSEDFAGQDEIMIAVSLSYTTHLVQMISQFLDVPLRYPMEHKGSRSQIRDHIIDKLSERERDFPLYSKGKERFQFNYGVYLLNKNIAQLRYYCGLGTTDLRLTLANLKTLLELRLGVKFDSPSSPTSAMPGQQMTIPPSLNESQQPMSAVTGNVLDNSDRSISPPPSESVSDHNHSSSSVSNHTSEEGNINNREKSSPSCLTTDKTQNRNIAAWQNDMPADISKSGLQESLSQSYADEVVCKEDAENKLPHSGKEGITVDSRDYSQTDSDHHNGDTSVRKKDNSVKSNLKPLPVSPIHTPVEDLGASKGAQQLTREKFIANVTNYEDVDASSEDSTNACYGSNFKIWPKGDKNELESDHSSNSLSENEASPYKDEVKITLTDIDSSKDHQFDCDIGFKTFKTKAMATHSISSPGSTEASASLNDDISFLPTENHKNDSVDAYQSVIRCDRLEDDGATFKLPAKADDGKAQSVAQPKTNIDNPS